MLIAIPPSSCALLNRYECSTTQNTCGSCYPGYIGIEGDSNVPCGATTKAAANAMSTRRLADLRRQLSSQEWEKHIVPTLPPDSPHLTKDQAIARKLAVVASNSAYRANRFVSSCSSKNQYTRFITRAAWYMLRTSTDNLALCTRFYLEEQLATPEYE